MISDIANWINQNWIVALAGLVVVAYLNWSKIRTWITPAAPPPLPPAPPAPMPDFPRFEAPRFEEPRVSKRQRAELLREDAGEKLLELSMVQTQLEREQVMADAAIAAGRQHELAGIRDAVKAPASAPTKAAS